MLHLRRAARSKSVQNGAQYHFSSQAGGRNLVAMEADVGTTAALDPVLLLSRGNRTGEQKCRHASNPLELLKKLSPPRVRDSRNMDAYDVDNIAKMRELDLNPAARASSNYEKIPFQFDAKSLSICREILCRSKDPYILRRAFWHLFNNCNTSHAVVRVLAIAFLKPRTAAQLPHLVHPIVRALFRSRSFATDKRIFSIYYALITRLEKSALRVDPVLYSQCAKFAARSRDPVAMKRALWFFRSSGVEMSSRTFRSIVAKCSIGSYGLGEVRNGKWKRNDLLPVILGFDGTKIKGGDDPDHHLGSFLNRGEYPFLVAWVQILGHCQAADVLWSEWKAWGYDMSHSQQVITSSSVVYIRKRESHIPRFIHFMLLAGDVRRAWMILSESKIDFWRLDIETRTRLFKRAESLHATKDAFPSRASLGYALLENYGHALECIEQKADIEWKSDGDGRHTVCSQDLPETRSAKLSDAEFDRVYG